MKGPLTKAQGSRNLSKVLAFVVIRSLVIRNIGVFFAADL
jgi:hypothetical protein